MCTSRPSGRALWEGFERKDIMVGTSLDGYHLIAGTLELMRKSPRVDCELLCGTSPVVRRHSYWLGIL